jgi:hypothetical protein
VVSVIITPDHIAGLAPVVPLLRPVLEYRARRFEPGGPLGYQEIKETRTLCDFDIMGRLCFPAGLLPRVRKVLQEHGYHVRIDDRREDGPRLCVDRDVLAECDSRERALLEAVARERLAQVEVQTDDDTLDRMLLIGSLFPDAQCVVAVATRWEAWKWWRDLEEHLEEKVGLALSGVERAGGRWLVGTFGSVPRDTAGEKDILFLPHAEEAAGTRAVEMVVDGDFRRRYAFVVPQRRPDRHVQLRLEQVAGPVIHHLARPRAPVHVVMLPTPDSTVAAGTTPLEQKRALYWHNGTRNPHIASVAGAVVEGDRAALKALGLRNRDIRLIREVDRTRAVVLVEAPEHGRELLLHLPGWRLLDLVLRATTGSDEDEAKNNSMPAVVTAAYAAKHSIKAHVLIRATGTAWPLRIKGFPPRCDDTQAAQVLVLDFVDDFDPRAKQDAQRRAEEYRRMGMDVRVPAGAQGEQ